MIMFKGKDDNVGLSLHDFITNKSGIVIVVYLNLSTKWSVDSFWML